MFTFKDRLYTVNSCLPLIMLNCPSKTLQPRFNILTIVFYQLKSINDPIKLDMRYLNTNYGDNHRIASVDKCSKPSMHTCRAECIWIWCSIRYCYVELLITCQTSKRLPSDSYLWWVNIFPLNKIICQFYQVPNLQSSVKGKLRAPYINY